MKTVVSMSVVLVVVAACLMLAFGAPQGSVDKGKAVYAKNNCKLCHSIAKEGNPKGPLDGVGAKLTEDLIKKWLRTPKSMEPKTNNMLVYGTDKISDGDLADLVAYLMSLKK